MRAPFELHDGADELFHVRYVPTQTRAAWPLALSPGMGKLEHVHHSPLEDEPMLHPA